MRVRWNQTVDGWDQGDVCEVSPEEIAHIASDRYEVLEPEKAEEPERPAKKTTEAKAPKNTAVR